MKNKSFAVFILSHGRADRVVTYDTLREKGYTGKIFILIDNEDDQQQDYINRYGDQVIIFDKSSFNGKFDIQDNFTDQIRGVVFARNANFVEAKKLGLKYYAQFDDDYSEFQFRFDNNYRYKYQQIKDLDRVFDAYIDFLKETPTRSIAMAQGGDFLGGENGSNPYCKKVQLIRKLMNTFFYKTDEPVQFLGRINEDVNMYVNDGIRGTIYFTSNHISVGQKQTQSNAGGLTDLYLAQGTYVKSFYTVMLSPSSVVVAPLHSSHKRLHHRIKWNNTVSCILRESEKK